MNCKIDVVLYHCLSEKNKIIKINYVGHLVFEFSQSYYIILVCIKIIYIKICKFIIAQLYVVQK